MKDQAVPRVVMKEFPTTITMTILAVQKDRNSRGYLVGSRPGTGQRLVLAIVSFVLWIMLFLIVVGIIIAYGSVNQLLEPFLVLGFLIFTAMVFLINIMFNRKH